MCSTSRTTSTGTTRAGDTLTDAISFEHAGNIAIVTFNRPQQRNALTLSMYEELAALCRRVNSLPDVRVLVLTGAGGSFVAGMDIAEFRPLIESGNPLDYSERMDAVFDAVENVRVPTLAAIDGPAAGAGAAIAVCCDLRIGSPAARFGFPIARTLGNALSPRVVSRLASIVGIARVKQLVFTAELLDAQAMLGAGILSALTDDAESFQSRARDYAQKVAANAPLTLRAAKAVLRQVQDRLTPEDALDAVAAAYLSQDFEEGVNAFLEKRKPAWRGE